MAKNSSLGRAKMEKNDEFYTRLIDIEKELYHYKPHFEGKIVFCNCDDPFESHFIEYFLKNFNELKLKKLIATCYEGSPIYGVQLSIADFEDKTFNMNTKNAYKFEVDSVSDLNKDGVINTQDLIEIVKKNAKVLKGDGDFRSEECIKLLKKADIVVTNPPFSLFNEYMAQLIEYDKKFLIIGNQNALHYKQIFPLVQENKIWFGYNDVKEFIKADGEIKKFGNILWYTNLDISKRHEKMFLYKEYDPVNYPKYENYDAIEVDSVANIPVDYFEKMGVPDSFLKNYNPDQFEIIGYGRGDFIPEIGTVPVSFLDDYHKVGGRGHITSGMKSLCFYDKEHYPKFPYSRIIIKRKDANNGN